MLHVFFVCFIPSMIQFHVKKQGKHNLDKQESCTITRTFHLRFQHTVMYISSKHECAKSFVPSSVSTNIAESELSVKRKEKKKKTTALD